MSIQQTLVSLFKTAAAVMEIKGEPVFKAIAFSKVARLLDDPSIDIVAAVNDGSIAKLPGIGKSSRQIIEDIVKTGESSDINELIASIPGGLIPMLQIPSLGPKTIAALWRERNITSIEQLADAIEKGELASIKGLGEKKIAAIKEGIAMRAQAGERRGILDVVPVTQELLEQVRQFKGVKRAEIAGSFRRWKETIGDIDIVCGVGPKISGDDLTAAFTKLPQVEKVLGQGGTKASVIVANGLQVDLRIVPEENFGAAIQYFTGSKEHNVKLRGLAQDKGLTLNEWGLYRLDQYEKAKKETGKPPAAPAVASKQEADIYAALGLEYIEPELREDRGEIEQAQAGTLPKLITLGDIRGDLHTHTTASDGVETILQMAEAAKKLGYQYYGITDHSRSQVIANGLSVERLLAHVRAIREIGSKIKGIKLLAGCEVDILVDGRLDYEDAVLAELDYVVASPHVSLKQDAQKATDRLLRAIDNKYVTILGHPTGRVINRRAGLPIDVAKVVDRAAKAGVALEINAGWPRWDLSDINARAALKAGAKLSVNTDAHSSPELQQMDAGLRVARRAGATAGDVINTMSYEQLKAFIAARR